MAIIISHNLCVFKIVLLAIQPLVNKTWKKMFGVWIWYLEEYLRFFFSFKDLAVDKKFPVNTLFCQHLHLCSPGIWFYVLYLLQDKLTFYW